MELNIMTSTVNTKPQLLTKRKIALILLSVLTVVLLSVAFFWLFGRTNSKTITVNVTGGSFGAYCLVTTTIDGTGYCVESFDKVKNALSSGDKTRYADTAPTALEATVVLTYGEQEYTFKSSAGGEDALQTKRLPTIYIQSVSSARIK